METPSADWWYAAVFVTLVCLGLAIMCVWAIAIVIALLLKALTWPLRRRYTPEHHTRRRPWVL